ncbi:MAG: GAF domain-containing protein [Kofleriaceae bacterium]
MLDEATNEWLRGLLARHAAVAGTVHVVKGDVLVIAAAVNIPPKVQEITATIPLGKGMAGLAWQHDKPIQTCNLKEDNSGAVKPGAKAVDAKAAVALPIHDPSGTIRAIVGLAWTHDNELSADVLAKISADAAGLA